MRKTADKKLVRFYLWTGAAYFFIGFLSTIAKFPEQPFAAIINNLWMLVFLVCVNFSLFEYSIPFLRRKRKSVLYNILYGILLLFLFMMIYSFGSCLWRRLGIALQFYTALATGLTDTEMLEKQMAYSMGSVFFFGITRHIYNYIKLKQAEQQLRIEKQAAELNYLRSQTNPHFLFNTLNNIYSLARDKSDLAPESILRLSKILRFMLYETGGDYIAAGQEIRIISDYIELEKLRYDESLHVNFNHDIEDINQSLPPLLLIPLVENAFKHGVAETRYRPYVDIHLSISRRVLLLKVRNSTDPATDRLPVKESIGLSNLRRQLALLYAEYDLTVQQNEADFTAILKINLATHV